ncbi:MAG: LPXTG cell wall anchor domain-containing protein [Lachnospiraceae bacterium]|nr:LPXTG cell wall anchor domain-containing protein [Lachnospiraceae bacterium]
MKKRVMTALMLMTLGLGMTTAVYAKPSKESKPVETPSKAPATGEANTVAGAVAAAIALGGVVVVSKKKMA